MLALALMLFVPLTAQSAEAEYADLIPQAKTTLDRIEKQLRSAENSTREELKSYANELDTIRSSALKCVADTDKELAKLEKERVILLPESANAADAEKTAETPTNEPEPESVSPEIARQLKELQERKVKLVEGLATCKLILLHVAELQTQTSSYLGNIRNRLLLAREPHLIDVIQTNLDNPGQWVDFTTRLAVKSTGWDVAHPLHLGGVATAGVLGFILGVLVRRNTGTRLARLKVEDNELSAGLLQAVFACAASYAPVILALAGSSAYFAIIPHADGDLSFVIYLLPGRVPGATPGPLASLNAALNVSATVCLR